MAKGLNKAMLIGHLGADPETRTTTSGTTVVNLRLATSGSRKDADGNWVDVTEWHRVVAFGKLAEICDSYLKKGRQIYIEGTIRTNKWTDKDGNDKYTTEIIANEMQMLGSKDGDAKAAKPKQEAAPKPPNNDVDEDDIPF